MSTVLTVLKYDFRRFLRDWLMVGFSVLMLIMYVAVVAFVPDDIAPEWQIAVTEDSALLVETVIGSSEMDEDADLVIKTFATEAEMRKAFEEGEDYFLGIAMDKDAKEVVAKGGRPKARVYVDESAPPEVQKTARAIGSMIAIAAFYPSTGPREEPERIGPAVDETSFQVRMRALMAIMILIMEMLALASLLSREISSGVVHAILTTTVSLPRYFTAKMVFGVLLAFVQAAVLAAAVGALAPAPLIITAQLFLGAVMFTAMGVIAGTRGAHLMEVLMWAMLFMAPALVPAFAVMLPGTPPLIVQALPSYPLVHGVLSAGQAAPLYPAGVLLAWTAGWAAVSCGFAYAALRWRVK
jgi:ABC-2 type transport system permease protein